MYAFDYARAGSVAEAAAALGADHEAKIVAGGMTLLPTLKQRLARPSKLIDLQAIGDLAGIRQEGAVLAIGAMTRHVEVVRSKIVQSLIPALASLAAGIGDPAVRNCGTIGGSIANNDPAADYPAACLGLNAVIVTDRREIAAQDYFTGVFATALTAGEIVTAVRFPKPVKAAYVKFPNPASRYAMVGVLVAQTSDGVRVAVTGAGQDGVFRATALERALTANFTPAALDGVSLDPDGLNSDLHALADYRAHLIGVMAKRAVAACA